MISDNETNFIYLSDLLPVQYPDFFKRFSKVLKSNDIDHDFIPGTNDIWAVDYMPLQVDHNKFVQFTYNPGYLQSEKWVKTITDTDKVCSLIGVNPLKSEIILDGGNVVHTKNKIIISEKVFTENKNYTYYQLIHQLEKLFETDKIYFVPVQPHDIIGHADGMVRFINDDTVIVNTYEKEDIRFRNAFKSALNTAGFEIVELVYNPYRNKNNLQANGCYINFIELKNHLIIPTFSIGDDDTAVRKMEEMFPGKKILFIESNDVANNGGVLNCISWNVLL